MSTFNFNSEVRGDHLQIGDNNSMVVNHGTVSPRTVQQAAELVRLVHEEAPHLAATAEAVHAEITAAQDDGAEPRRGRIRTLLQQLPPGLALGSAALTLVQQLMQVFSG